MLLCNTLFIQIQPQYILALEASCFAVDLQAALALCKQKTKHCVSFPCYVDVAKAASFWGNNKAFCYLQYTKVGKAWYLFHVIFKRMLPGRRNSTHFDHAMFSHHGFRTLAEISYIIRTSVRKRAKNASWQIQAGLSYLTYILLLQGGRGGNFHKWEPWNL